MVDREQAMIENTTPGPGSRTGTTGRRSSIHRRHGHDAKKRLGNEDSENDETVGWGGFPLNSLPPSQGKRTQSTMANTTGVPVAMVANESSAEAAEIANGNVAPQSLNGANDLIAPDEGVKESDGVKQNQTSSPAELNTGNTASQTMDNFNSNYYFHAQQAFIIASLGGLSLAFDSKAAEPGPPPEIGKGLFLAINLITWEDDPEVILEMGWAATWWQDKLEKASGEPPEQMNDRGHYL